MTALYCVRNKAGAITALYEYKLDGVGMQPIAADHPDTIAFVAATRPQLSCPPPEIVNLLSPSAWLRRLDRATLQAIWRAKKSNDDLDLELSLGAGADYVDVAGEEAKALVGLLLNLQLITVEQSAVLLKP